MFSNPMPFDKLRLFKMDFRTNGTSENLSETALNNFEEVGSLDDANVAGSQFRDTDLHMLAVDLDVSAALVPSSTPGHSHLFIGRQMSWEQYERVLDALADAGILERGYVNASKARKFSAVRLPWVRKDRQRRRA